MFKTLHVIVGLLLSVILFLRVKIFLMTFPIGCIVSFCSKTLPLNTPLFEETMFEKSLVWSSRRNLFERWRRSSNNPTKIFFFFFFFFFLNLVDSKLATGFDGVFCVRVRTFEITEWVFVRFFWNQLWLSFRLVNKEIKVFPGKVTLKERSVSYSKMNTLLFCVFTFRVDCEMYSLSEMKSTFGWKKMNSL